MRAVNPSATPRGAHRASPDTIAGASSGKGKYVAKFNETDVQKHLEAVGLETVLVDAEPLLDAVLPVTGNDLDEYDEPEFELWKLLKRKAIETSGQFLGSAINLPLDKTRHMFVDLLGTHGDGLFVLELKIDKPAERNAFTELLGYSNYIAGLFPGMGGKDILNILVTPMDAKIARQAYLYDLLISDRSVILYQPDFPAGTAESLRLDLYIPEDKEFQHFANRLLSHEAMSCVVASFDDIPGWIEYDDANPDTLPTYTREALKKITAYTAQIMEHEGLHGFCYVRKRWHSIQVRAFGEAKTDLIICAINPFRLIDEERVNLVTDQLPEDDRAVFTDAPLYGFINRLLRLAKRSLAECIDAEHPTWLETPYWGAMVTAMIETVFADHLGFRPTGMFREAYVEQLAATRRYNATVPAMAVDVERLQVDDIGNWLRAWQFMEACGFVAGEAGDQAKPVHRRRRSDLEGAPGTA